MRKWLSVIGDCHSERNAYLHMIRECEYSIQIGDLDFDYDWLVSKGVDVSRHRWLPGNHDNYDLAFASPHCLGDFGTHSVPEFGDVFYVRGAWSIDHMARMPCLARSARYSTQRITGRISKNSRPNKGRRRSLFTNR